MTLAPDHYKIVAEVYWEAIEAGEPTGSRGQVATNQAVAETWGVPMSTANGWIKRAKAMGLLPSIPRSPRPRSALPTLRDLREKRGLTLEAVGVLAGVDIATISRIERGLVEPRQDTVVKLARGLGVSARRMMQILSADVEDPS